MGEYKDLTGKEAIEKLQKLVKSADICLFTTSLTQLPLATRPMSTQEVDDDGSLWFFSGKSSNKNEDIIKDNRVQLFYYNKGSSEYLSVFGEAELLHDRQQIERLWSPIVKTWFTEGKDDPDLQLIRVRPTEAHYWDTKHNKMVAGFKILTGAITGVTMDDGVEGKMTLTN
jgi:general stress protein 26